MGRLPRRLSKRAPYRQALCPTSSILDALRPAPDVQIKLRGGIRLQYSQWLIGFPPAIRLVGAAADAPASRND